MRLTTAKQAIKVSIYKTCSIYVDMIVKLLLLTIFWRKILVCKSIATIYYLHHHDILLQQPQLLQQACTQIVSMAKIKKLKTGQNIPLTANIFKSCLNTQ